MYTQNKILIEFGRQSVLKPVHTYRTRMREGQSRDCIEHYYIIITSNIKSWCCTGARGGWAPGLARPYSPVV